MNKFEFYLEEGKVKKVKEDLELSKSLLKDAKERFDEINRLKSSLSPKMIFENIYDALRDLLDAILAAEGYKSYSHEASISYLKKCGFEYSVIMELDGFRFKRNASKYYGKGILNDDAKSIVLFYEKYSGKIIKIIDVKIHKK